MRKCASSDSASFFVFSHNDVPFEGLENKILYFDPIPPSKNGNFGPIFDGTKNFRSKGP